MCKPSGASWHSLVPCLFRSYAVLSTCTFHIWVTCRRHATFKYGSHYYYRFVFRWHSGVLASYTLLRRLWQLMRSCFLTGGDYLWIYLFDGYSDKGYRMASSKVVRWVHLSIASWLTVPTYVDGLGLAGGWTTEKTARALSSVHVICHQSPLSQSPLSAGFNAILTFIAQLWIWKNKALSKVISSFN